MNNSASNKKGNVSKTDTLLLYASLVITAAIVLVGINTLLLERITAWGALSLTVSLFLLVVFAVMASRVTYSFFTLAAYLYASVLAGRLFSTLRLPGDMSSVDGASLDPLLLGETGPGIPSIMWLSYGLVALITLRLTRVVAVSMQADSCSVRDGVNKWAIIFLRVYVGLMFIAHYSGHVLAGPDQFQVFSEYFSTVGFKIGGPMVVLAGLIEIAVSIGLVFGFFTRIAAIGGVLYLFLATLWGDHFTAGYIWILPTGGWEFSALWMFAVLIFAFTGGGEVSVDEIIRKRIPTGLKWATH